MLCTVSKKGQITVPKRLREQLSISAGDRLELTEEEGHLVARKAATCDPVAAAYGILNTEQATDEIMRELRYTSDAG